MPVHGADLKKYINAVSLRIIADAKEYGVAAVMVLLYAVAVQAPKYHWRMKHIV